MDEPRHAARSWAPPFYHIRRGRTPVDTPPFARRKELDVDLPPHLPTTWPFHNFEILLHPWKRNKILDLSGSASSAPPCTTRLELYGPRSQV